ncbi:hypothetical protein SEA_ESTES_139 [Mycobacterium phage Estes]|uniref:Uncharacterized protein n=2 Tax=Reyvirus TaxID=1623301 RepID=A0A7G9A2I8_9CAUD|nr:hypothetical protein J4U03_gp136 [Mycobacterium phage Estes]YP_010014026.1 hypothetical protein J4U04_gp139 [Mycobacterium phage MrMagoo]APQ42223.1 hypothetical protein PBI_MRMAGOO_141 [Mycobacterium phage MrMagoo]ARM70294.1 hypothetical protein SEA_GARDENSALSA_139 [Mycobacterium phage GardenSalsa]QNL30827.1 hypothetical protein SEA_ESTES_139 [Mycobacterium phage Estes]
MSRGSYLPREHTGFQQRVNEQATSGLVIDSDDLYGRHSFQVIHEFAAGERESAVYARPGASYFVRSDIDGVEGIWPR